MKIKSILERNPIIPAIKDNITLEKALNSNSEIVFIILANIVNIKEYCDKYGRTDNIDELTGLIKIVLVIICKLCLLFLNL